MHRVVHLGGFVALPRFGDDVDPQILELLDPLSRAVTSQPHFVGIILPIGGVLSRRFRRRVAALLSWVVLSSVVHFVFVVVVIVVAEMVEVFVLCEGVEIEAKLT